MQGKASFTHLLHTYRRSWQGVPGGMVTALARTLRGQRDLSHHEGPQAEQSFLTCSGGTPGQPIGQVALQVYLGHDGRVKPRVKPSTSTFGHSEHEGEVCPHDHVARITAPHSCGEALTLGVPRLPAWALTLTRSCPCALGEGEECTEEEEESPGRCQRGGRLPACGGG